MPVGFNLNLAYGLKPQVNSIKIVTVHRRSIFQVKSHYTTRTAPRFVCSTKLSPVQWRSYLDGWLNTNTRYWLNFFCFLHSLSKAIVHSRADGVSKSLRQKSFFARGTIVSSGQNIIFRDNKRYKQRLGPPVLKRRQFSDPFSRARVLRREKNNGKGDLASEPSRFASLSEGEMTERHSGKTKQNTNWSVSTFKGKRKSFCFEIVKFKTRAFNRKIEIKPIPFVLNSLTGNNHFWYCRPFFTSDLMHNSTPAML